MWTDFKGHRTTVQSILPIANRIDWDWQFELWFTTKRNIPKIISQKSMYSFLNIYILPFFHHGTQNSIPLVPRKVSTQQKVKQAAICFVLPLLVWRNSQLLLKIETYSDLFLHLIFICDYFNSDLLWHFKQHSCLLHATLISMWRNSCSHRKPLQLNLIWEKFLLPSFTLMFMTTHTHLPLKFSCLAETYPWQLNLTLDCIVQPNDSHILFAWKTTEE